ncbi:polar amino acid transport system ATP-binding protein [Paenibacillus phyllosphaerae]|uniref:Polar amino acid transport system ATP-binding protein n=1 Tax=Paenibacillus phyllosphaerae TaxID=274593 RepID=A0A7W5B332_9BACL|nr:ectoine/hydroxyectoine ABC transporter ATP-binding protein EhuA [Paenibacillus phyllosphaerae]MBB3113423.1 polar amino acid transport system ATP-binding protein [Paenibacillus phyllosphaerae]
MNQQLAEPSAAEKPERPVADAKAPPLVQYEQVTKRYGELEVIKGIDLTLQPGEKLALIGPSGSGKTTLGRMLATLEKPTSGRILVEGESLWEMRMPSGKTVPANDRHLRRLRGNIGMVFQHFNLFPHMSVIDNVTLAPRSVLGLSKEEAHERAVTMLGKVGLDSKLSEFPSRLSGGQKQRVAIARALVMQPKVMVFDEVTSALDPELVGEVLAVMKEIARDSDMAMMLITHEMDFARDIADRVVFGAEGRIVEQGTPADIFGQPRSERLRSFLSRFG